MSRRGSLTIYRKNRAILLADAPMCHYCRTKPATTADHWIPVVKGGPDTLDNLVPACAKCNNHKRDTMPWDFKPKSIILVAPSDW